LNPNTIGAGDVITLNTPTLLYADGSSLGASNTAPAAGGARNAFFNYGPNRVLPGTPRWVPPAVDLGVTYRNLSYLPITSDQYLPVTVDPATGYSEEIWLTALINSDPIGGISTWSCIRGAGSSTGAPGHSINAYVTNGPTPYDKLLLPDDPWGGNLGYDYYFQGDSTNLPSYTWNGVTYTWTWLNQGNATYNEAFGHGAILLPPTASANWRGMQLSLPTQRAWTSVVKMSTAMAAANYGLTGFCLYDSVSGKLMSLGWEYNSGFGTLFVQTFSSLSSAGSLLGTYGSCTGPTYLQIQQIAPNTYNFSISPDGSNWMALESNYNTVTSITMTPTSLFVGCYTSANAGYVIASLERFTVR